MSATSSALRRVTLDVNGMTCSACVSRLESAFNGASGVESAIVNLSLEKATLLIDPQEIELHGLREIVEEAGFNVGTQDLEYLVEGMSCSACSSRVESVLLNTPGVLDADVNLALAKARVKVITHEVSDQQLIQSIDQAGYKLIAPTAGVASKRESERIADRDKRVLFISCLICVPFLIQMVAQFFDWDSIHMMPAAEAVLATILQLLVAHRFYRSAFNALRGKTANMDVLVVLGTGTAYLFSWYLMLTLGEAAEGELYFEATALILTFVLIGKLLESRAKHATTTAVRELMDLRPKLVRIQDGSGEWQQKPVSELQLGTQFEVRPGDRISADGEVVTGTSTVDESLLTGESSPVIKTNGDQVFEGTINSDGRLVIETTALGDDSTLQKIVHAIENAQSGKLMVQRLVDRVSAVFVPFIIGVALLVLASWLLLGGGIEVSLINAVTVLVIACPCALGLATPTAIITGTGVAARSGVLFKDIHSIEIAQRVDTIAFDKTGTLTTGEIVLQEITPLGELDENSVLQLAASLQNLSEHPIATAFVNKVQQLDVELDEVSNFRSYVAEGVTGEISNQTYFLGNERMLDRLEVAHPSGDSDEIYLVKDGKVLARFSTSDQLRQEAKESIERLNKLGIQTTLLSGDTQEKTQKIATELNISNYQSRLKPEEKVAALDELSSQNHVVGMVGDGVNDAPALARADLGIAMTSGTDVSLEVAPVALMRNDLSLIAQVIQASRVTFRKIKQNLFWAFIYNVTMLPLAALGFLTPTLAGIAMALSSVSVVCNSLLLKTWKPS